MPTIEQSGRVGIAFATQRRLEHLIDEALTSARDILTPVSAAIAALPAIHKKRHNSLKLATRFVAHFGFFPFPTPKRLCSRRSWI